MKIASLRMAPLRIPFRVSFKHSSADRKMTGTVLALCATESGNAGLGEGCPRPYVTGEDIPSCLAFFSRFKDDLSESVRGLGDLRAWAAARQPEIDKNPAAWCALESALIDALAQDARQSVESLLGLPELAGRFTYTAVLGDSAEKTFSAQMQRYAAMEFSDFKVKVGGDSIRDGERLSLLAKKVPGARIRLDANNLWKNAQEALRYLRALPFPPFAVEEPLQAMDYTGMRALADETGLPIILDESFLGQRHFQDALSLDGKAILNLRVSKMGGLLRSLAVAEEAAQRRLPMIVGAQVGETSILTRAALAVANAYRENVLAQEGAFGTLLLESDVAAKPLMFGHGGGLEPGKLLAGTRGWGLDFLPDALP